MALSRQHKTSRMRVFHRVGDPHDAKTAETVELTRPSIGRKGGKIDRHGEGRALDRPVDRLARPCVAALQEFGDLAFRIEVEEGGKVGKAHAFDSRSLRPHGFGKLMRNGAEATRSIDLPDETACPAIRIEHERRGGCRFVGWLVRVNRQRLGLGGLREMRFLCLGRTVFQALCVVGVIGRGAMAGLFVWCRNRCRLFLVCQKKIVCRRKRLNCFELLVRILLIG